jgi:hypothetical protein
MEEVKLFGSSEEGWRCVERIGREIKQSK